MKRCPASLSYIRRYIMLDIKDKDGKVVAVLMDDGTVIKKEKITDDIDKMIKEKLGQMKERK
jgi:urease gamma subunit